MHRENNLTYMTTSEVKEFCLLNYSCNARVRRGHTVSSMNRISLALTRIETKNAGGTETKENPCFLPIYFVGFVE